MAKIKLLTEDADSEYVSQEDVLIYAKQIGIDVKKETHLLWIAKEGLTARVPDPWLIFSDEKDRIFYYNPDTKENSWDHPLDRKYTSLVCEERTRSKSLNSTSSDYGFESKLSSLADAPPLSSSGKNTPSSGKLRKNEAGLSGKKFEFGKIENRRSTQLAPVRLNNMKMPAASQKSSSGMSFMPKGSTLTKNVRRMKEESNYNDNAAVEQHGYVSHVEDSNESLNSDDGSKYSYEESEDDDKNFHGTRSYDLLDISQLSPMPSADESPDALEINSLVQLSTKQSKLSSSKQLVQKDKPHNRENPPSLNLRKVGQPSFLKPLTEVNKKRESFKGSHDLDPLEHPSKRSKKGSSKSTKIKINKYSDNETDVEEKVDINDAQNIMIEQIQKEWMAMQDEITEQEREKLAEMRKESLKKLEEEEEKLRTENAEKISEIKIKLKREIEDEQAAAEKKLEDLRDSNKEKLAEEQNKFLKEMEILTQSLKSDIQKLGDKNAEALAQKQKEFEESCKAEIQKLQLLHSSQIKAIEEAQSVEIVNLQDSHKEKIEKMKEKDVIQAEEIGSPKGKNSAEDHMKLSQLIKEEEKNYQILQNRKENVLKEICTQESILEKLKIEISECQLQVHELQDEMDKIENDLDLLRSEKSTLISELNTLKDNIKNEKSNLLNLEKKKKNMKPDIDISREFVDVGINTLSLVNDAASKASQVSVSYNEFSCQVNCCSTVVEAFCQTTYEKDTVTKSLQTDPILFEEKVEIRNELHEEKIDMNKLTDKALEKTLSGLGIKLDSRISVIEQQLKSLQEHLSNPSQQHTYSSQEPANDLFSQVTALPNVECKNSEPLQSFNQVPSNHISKISFPSHQQVKCRCELGDVESCNVMQDVKNSIYHLNNILSHDFVPSVRGTNICHFNQPTANYSSPFEKFYTQLREIQEKKRLSELKHRCENEVAKLTKSSSSTSTDSSASKLYSTKHFAKPTQFVQPNSYNICDDPLNQARNLLLREKAKAWKEQQNFSLPHISSNVSSSLEIPHSSFIGINNSFGSASQHSFLNFEVDPETDYSNWMSRLNALQLRIRSHKLL